MSEEQINVITVLYSLHQKIGEISKLQATDLANIGIELEYLNSENIDIDTLDETITLMLDCFRASDHEDPIIVSHESNGKDPNIHDVFYICFNIEYVENLLKDYEHLGTIGSILAYGRIKNIELLSHSKMLLMIEKIKKLLELV